MIKIEEKLLPIKNLTEKEQLPLHLLCVVNTTTSRPRNSKIDLDTLEQLMGGMNIHLQDNYTEMVSSIRKLIQHTQHIEKLNHLLIIKFLFILILLEKSKK